MTRVIRPTLVRAFRRASLPLGSYYIVTLGLPLANGAAQSGAAFFNHALVVIVVPPILIALGCMLHLTARVLIRSFRSACLACSNRPCERTSSLRAAESGEANETQ